MKSRFPLVLLCIFLSAIHSSSDLDASSLQEDWEQALKEKVTSRSPGGLNKVGTEWIRAQPESALARQAIAEAWVELDYPSLAFDMASQGLDLGDSTMFLPLVARAYLASGQPAAAWNAIATLDGEEDLKNQVMANAMMPVLLELAADRISQAAVKAPENLLLNERAVLLLFEAGKPHLAIQRVEELFESNTASANLLAKKADNLLAETATLERDDWTYKFGAIAEAIRTAKKRGLSPDQVESLEGRQSDLTDIYFSGKGVENNDAELREIYLEICRAETGNAISRANERLENSENLSSEQILETTDELFALGKSSTLLWEMRRTACQKLGLEQEAIAAAAQELSIEENPAARKLLLDGLAQSSGLIAEAKKLATENNPTGAAQALRQAMMHNPVSMEPLATGYQLASDAGDDLAASLFLNDFRRMGGSTPGPKKAASLAVRMGNWELLLSLCIENLREGEEDFFWDYQLFLAELALKLPGRDTSFARLRGTVYEAEARLAQGFSGFARKGEDPENVVIHGKAKGLAASYKFMLEKKRWSGTQNDNERKDQLRAELDSWGFSDSLKLHAKYVLGDLSKEQLLEQTDILLGGNVVEALCLLADNQTNYLDPALLLTTQYDPLLPAALKAPLYLALANQEKFENPTPLRMEDKVELARLSPDYLSTAFQYMERTIAEYSRVHPEALDSLTSRFVRKEAEANSPAMRTATMLDYSHTVKMLVEKENLDKAQAYLRMIEAVVPVVDKHPELGFDVLFDIDLPDAEKTTFIKQLTKETRQIIRAHAQKVVKDYEESHSFGDEIYTAYPPGSPYYAIVVESRRNGDSMAELQRKVVAAQKRSLQEWKNRPTFEERQRALIEEKRKRQERLTQEFNESLKYRQPSRAGWQGFGAQTSTANQVRSSTTPSSSYQYKPSERQRLQNYRNQLDQRMNRAMGGTGWGAAF